MYTVYLYDSQGTSIRIWKDVVISSYSTKGVRFDDQKGRIWMVYGTVVVEYEKDWVK